MQKGGGKRKGSGFERDFAKWLSLWLTEGKRNDCIWRTSNSGGKATVTKSDTQCGDLHAVRPEATKFFEIFSLELKFYKELNLLDFNKKTFKLLSWWKQTLLDAERAKKEPLLIFKINRKGTWAVHRPSTMFDIDTNIMTMCLNISDTESSTFLIEPLTDYFKRLNPDMFR